MTKSIFLCACIVFGVGCANLKAKVVEQPKLQWTFYCVMKFTSDSGSGVFQLYVCDSAEFEAKHLRGKPDEIILRADDDWRSNKWTKIQDLKSKQHP